MCEGFLPSRTTRLLIHFDHSTLNLAVARKFTMEPVIIDIPGQLTNKQVLLVLVIALSTGLGLLRSGCGDLLCLALLGRRLCLALTVRIRGVVRARVGSIAIRIGV